MDAAAKLKARVNTLSTAMLYEIEEKLNPSAEEGIVRNYVRAEIHARATVAAAKLDDDDLIGAYAALPQRGDYGVAWLEDQGVAEAFFARFPSAVSAHGAVIDAGVAALSDDADERDFIAMEVRAIAAAVAAASAR